MLDIIASAKSLKDETPSEKIYLLKVIAHQMLGPKWVYFRKIKHAGEGFKLFKEKSLMEQMKATQAALKFTSKHARKKFRTIYKETLRDIKANTNLRSEDFPPSPEYDEKNQLESLTSEHDEVLITWTPIKFFQSVKTIREKGVATQRHSEGLAAKLMFKVIGYYAAAENWDEERLTFYLRKLDRDSSYQDVAGALTPLKEDLQKFTELYEPFKFGKVSLSKDKSTDEGVFDDTFGVESFEDEIKTLYWYHFIYWAVELFLFRYYVTLATATDSKQAIRYLTQIFEPALLKAIEIKNVFLGSFETDRSKKKYRLPYRKYQQEKRNEPLTKKIKTQNGIFETYTYNLTMLEDDTMGYSIENKPKEDSEWGRFVKFNIYSAAAYKLTKGEPKPEEIPFDTTEYALMHILKCMVNCTGYERTAKHKIIDRFKKRLITDKELASKRVKEVKQRGEKQIGLMERKITKLRRMKQSDAAEVYLRDIEAAKQKIEEKCDEILESTQLEIALQKRRLQSLFQEFTQDQDVDEGKSARFLLALIRDLTPQGDFMRDFIKRVSGFIQNEYETELEPFYKNIFNILNPSTQEKVILIQSLQKSGGDQSIHLQLTDEEKEKTENMINLLKAKIKGGMPDIFNCKLIFLTSVIPIEDLFKLGIDNKSLKMLLGLKVTSPKNAKPTLLQDVIVKALMVLNLVTNPVPKHNLIQPGREHMKDPQQAINGAMLTQLLSDLPKQEVPA
ncbi:MAG: hypothetical protein MJE63_15580 [Proteobacteria bacterium]|nr:hypothetical protein [Pseudomonadota bacterium]